MLEAKEYAAAVTKLKSSYERLALTEEEKSRAAYMLNNALERAFLSAKCLENYEWT